MTSAFTVFVGLGFILAGAAWSWAAVTDDRSIPMMEFGIGFILASIGIVGGTVSAPRESFGRFNPLGPKLAAVGFGVAAIPIAIGSLMLGKSDAELMPFFVVGFLLILVGIAVHGVSIFRKTR